MNTNAQTIEQAKHTPGPWYMEGEDRFAEVLGSDQFIIAESHHVHGKTPDEWDEIHVANMQLIAAAPDLLEALQKFVTINSNIGYEFECNEPELYKLIVDAIAKATGAGKAVSNAMKTRTEQIASERADYGRVVTQLNSLTKSTEMMADMLHKLRNVIVQRLEPPATLLRINEAAKRAGISVATMRRLDARGVFTDHRRGKAKGSMRTYYADEIDSYLHDGERGVQRLREELGRD